MNLERATEPEVDAAYLAATLGKPPHPLYELLANHLGQPGVALDLGCGVGNGARHLLSQGWSVWALDQSEEALAMCRAHTPVEAKVDWVLGDMRDMPFPRASLVVACFSLFFLAPDEFESVWERIHAALTPGGLFAGQLLGERDEWAAANRSTHPREEIARLLSPFEVLHLEEVEREGKTVTGKAKRWHVFHVIARKP